MRIIHIIFLVILIFFIAISDVQAKKQKSETPQIKFNGEKYTLLYSVKGSETNGYLNEYFKKNESYYTWKDILAVHHMPNAYSPIDEAKVLRDALGSMMCPSAIEIDEENNSAILDFIMINSNKLPIILEFNVFKYQKDSVCGTVALQYAKRYVVSNALEVERIKKILKKERNKYVKKVRKYELPKLIEADIDNGKYVKNLKEAIVDEEKELLDNSAENTEGLEVNNPSEENSIEENVEQPAVENPEESSQPEENIESNSKEEQNAAESTDNKDKE